MRNVMPLFAAFLLSLWGCSEGDEVQPTSNLTDIDGNTYKTVVIGEQEWMAENLRVTKYRNEDEIPGDLSDEAWQNNTNGARAIYDHDNWDVEGVGSPEEMVAAYGKLYNWFAVTDPRGLCPPGWRVPSDKDWEKLIAYVGERGFPNEDELNGAANALKSCRQVGAPEGGDCDTSEHPRWEASPSWGGGHVGFDEFGFSGLPGGFRGAAGMYAYLGTNGRWWSSTEYSTGNALFQTMFFTSGEVEELNLSKRSGYSVRCVRDIE